MGNEIKEYESHFVAILSDFTLATKDLFGATTDAGSDVKWMMAEGLKLKWEWCIPHMVNAATKKACGMNQNSKNQRFRSLSTESR